MTLHGRYGITLRRMQRRARRYDLVIFDLDGTLRANLPEDFEFRMHCAREAGVQLTPAQIKAFERASHRYWCGSARINNDFARFTQRQFWENYNTELLTEAGLTPATAAGHAARMQDVFEAAYAPRDTVFYDSFVVLRALREAGYRTGLASNRNGELDTYTRAAGLRDLLDFTLTAEQAGGWKPDPPLFERALALGGVSADRAIYIGDNYFADVLGARSAGLAALLIDPRDVYAEIEPQRVRHLGDVIAFLAGDDEAASQRSQ
jgi:FMN phosphatase YigB (HAD superfamily)